MDARTAVGADPQRHGTLWTRTEAIQEERRARRAQHVAPKTVHRGPHRQGRDARATSVVTTCQGFGPRREMRSRSSPPTRSSRRRRVACSTLAPLVLLSLALPPCAVGFHDLSIRYPSFELSTRFTRLTRLHLTVNGNAADAFRQSPGSSNDPYQGASAAAPPSFLANLTTDQSLRVIRTFGERGYYDSMFRFTKSTSTKSQAVYEAALAQLCRRLPDEALELFHEMEARDLEPSAQTMESVMISISILYGSDVDTLLFWQNRLLELYPKAWLNSSRPWDETLSALGDCPDDPGAWQAALSLFKAMKRCGVEPGTRTYQSLFRVCGTHDGDGTTPSATDGLLKELLALEGRRPARLLTPRLWSSILRAYASANDRGGCRRALLAMHELGMSPSVHHVTFYLQSLLPDTRQMLAVLLRMAGAPANNTASIDEDVRFLPPVAPDAVSIKAVLRSCGMVGDYDAAVQLLRAVQNGTFGDAVGVDEAMYNHVLSSCADPVAAKELIREMRLTRRYRRGCVPPSLVSYTHAITACRRAANLASALHFLRLARVDGLEPDVVMYTAAVWASAKARNVTAAKDLLNEMRARNCTPNEISYHGVMDACASCGDADEAMRMYGEMIGSGHIPTGQTFQLLARTIRLHDNATAKVNWLLDVYESMTRGQRTANAGGPIMEALIQELAGLNRFDDALRVFESIEGPSGAACLRSILSACSTVAPPRWEDALSLLHASDVFTGSAVHSRVDPNALGYAMLACSKADQFEESLNLLHLYGGSDTPLPAINSLIGACGRRGRPDVAMMVLNDAEDRGVKLDARGYRNAIIACNQGQHRSQRDPQDARRNRGFEWWECAVSLIRRMKERGLRPDVKAYSSCISACEVAGQWQAALSLLQTLLDEEDDPGNEHCALNLHCFNAAISACAKGGAWVEALELYERMKTQEDRRLRPTTVTLGSLIDGLDRAGQKDLAKRVHLEGVRKKVIHPWRRTRTSDGTTINAMDLHAFTAAMARAAVSSHVDSLVQTQDPLEEDWIIVVGKGLRSEDGPVLQATVTKLLRDEYGIKSFLDGENSGRVVVTAPELTRFREKHHT